MISNELLEAHVLPLRGDLADLRAEFRAAVARIDHDIRALATKAESEIKTAVASFHEQFKEFRQDVRELRAENKSIRESLSTRIDTNYEALDRKIDATREALSEKIDSNYAALDRKIDATHEALNAKIDSTAAELRREMKDIRGEMKEMRADIATLRTDVSDLKGMMKAVLWLLGSLCAIVTILGVGFTIAKGLHWI